MMKEGNLKDIEGKIWAMANELRGSMDASDFKNYILALVFYRYLSERQEQYMMENGLFENYREDESANENYAREAGESEEDRKSFLDILSRELGYAIAPEDTWETLVEKVRKGECRTSDFQNLFDRFNESARMNPNSEKDFRGIFDDVNLSNSRLGSTVGERGKSMESIVALVDSIPLSDGDGRDVLGRIYEYLIKQFAANAGKKGGEFFSPYGPVSAISRIIAHEWDGNGRTFEVLDPTCGSGSLLLTVEKEIRKKGGEDMNIKFYGEELNTTTFNLARMNLMMHGVTYRNMSLRNADTLGRDWPDGIDPSGKNRPRFVDAVVANPPFSVKWAADPSMIKDPRFMDYGKLAPKSKADLAFVLHGLYHLKPGGTMGVILPHGVLFRGNAEGAIRKALVEKNQIHAVIGLPQNLFFGASIPAIILVLKKSGRPSDDILFIDASQHFEKGKNQNYLRDEDVDRIVDAYVNRKDIDKFAHLASKEEIVQNEYNLNIPRYVDITEDEEPVDLQAVISSLRSCETEIERLNSRLSASLVDLGVLKAGEKLF